jgi:hypothetical protein
MHRIFLPGETMARGSMGSGGIFLNFIMDSLSRSDVYVRIELRRPQGAAFACAAATANMRRAAQRGSHAVAPPPNHENRHSDRCRAQSNTHLFKARALSESQSGGSSYCPR